MGSIGVTVKDNLARVQQEVENHKNRGGGSAKTYTAIESTMHCTGRATEERGFHHQVDGRRDCIDRRSSVSQFQSPGVRVLAPVDDRVMLPSFSKSIHPSWDECPMIEGTQKWD